MLVFKTYFKLLGRNKGQIIMYFCIFIGIVTLLSTVAKSTSSSSYEKVTSKVAIINEDNSQMGKDFKKYMKKNNKIVSIGTDKKSIQDYIYWRQVSAVFVIPKGYEKAMLDGNQMNMKVYTIPNSKNSMYVELDVKNYIKLLDTYLTQGYSQKDASEYAAKDAGKTAKVSVYGGKINEPKSYEYFYMYMPYVLICICILGIGTVMMIFQDEEIRKRSICSSMNVNKMNLNLLVAEIVFSLATYVILVGVSIVMSKGEFITNEKFVYYLANSFVYLLICMAIGFFMGNISKNTNMLNGLLNVIALGTCFLGGVFVPQEILPNEVLKVAHYIPTYWYIRVNTSIGSMNGTSDAFQTNFEKGIAIQLMFAVTILILALVTARVKNTKKIA